MNPYTSLLSNAVNAASLNTRATRETIYSHARKTLLTHFETATPEQMRAELDRLNDAVDIVEGTMSSVIVSENNVTATLDATRHVTPPPIYGPDLAERPEQPLRNAARDDKRRFRPFQLRGLVLRVLGLLSNPYFLLLSLCLGVYIGLFSKITTMVLTPIADLYIELLKMVLIPFMISAIVVSLSRLFGSEVMRRHLGSIFAVFISGLAATALVGVLAATLMAPGGNISGTARQALGHLINESPYAVDLEITMNLVDDKASPTQQTSLLDRIVPDNIFHALTAGENLKILFFAIAFGVALGSLQTHRSNGLHVALLSVYDVCTQLIAWVNMLLPVALCGMVAKQVANVGTEQLLAMLRFTVAFSLTAALLCLLSIGVLAWASGAGLSRTFRAIRQPLLLAMATRSSVTCIPSAMTALTEALGYDPIRVQLLLPLGITLFRFGPVLYYAFTTIFVSQLYGISVSPVGYTLALVGAILTGLASAGTTGVLTISLLGVIFQPLGLPLEAALALLVTVDPVIDIFRTACIVVPNCAAVAFIYRGDKRTAYDEVMPDAQAGNASS